MDATNQDSIEHLRRLHEVLEKDKNKLTRDELHLLRGLFHKVPQLGFIPKSIWSNAVLLFSLRKLNQGEVLAKGSIVQLYVVLTGSFQAESGEKFVVGDVFGNFEPVNGKRCMVRNVVATQASSVVELLPDELAALIQQENLNQANKDLLNFLAEAIPNFEQLSATLKQKLIKYFVEKVFMPGHRIFSEGNLINCAYLIKEGRCKIIAAKNSDEDHEQDEDLDFDSPSFPNGMYLKGKNAQRGYRSVSTNRYQIMTIGPKEWFGEEILFEDCLWKPIDYSVVAVVRTTALYISKENLSRFPGDVIAHIKRNNYTKQQWKVNRKIELSKSIMEINRMDLLNNYLSKVTEVQTKSRQPESETVRWRETYTRYPLVAHTNILPVNKSMETKRLQHQNEISLKNSSHSSYSMYGGPKCVRNFAFQKSQLKLVNDVLPQMYMTRMANSQERSTSNRRVLEVASTFKTVHNRRFLRPTIVCKSFIKRQLKPEYTKFLIDGKKKVLKLKNDEFIVGVKEVKIVDTESLKPPPSPNIARIRDFITKY